MVKVVILDVDGTLTDTNYLHVEAWARALEEVREPVPRSLIHEQIGKGSDKLILEFVESQEDSEKVSELYKKFYAEIQDRAHPLPGAKALISSLSERGYEVWFATSAEPEELEHHMKTLEAEDKVAGVVSSRDAEESKPSPDIFDLALKRAGGSPEEAVVIGDSVWDVEAAKEVGVKTVSVMTCGAFSRAPSLRRPGPTPSTRTVPNSWSPASPKTWTTASGPAGDGAICRPRPR